MIGTDNWDGRIKRLNFGDVIRRVKAVGVGNPDVFQWAFDEICKDEPAKTSLLWTLLRFGYPITLPQIIFSGLAPAPQPTQWTLPAFIENQTRKRNLPDPNAIVHQPGPAAPTFSRMARPIHAPARNFDRKYSSKEWRH